MVMTEVYKGGAVCICCPNGFYRSKFLRCGFLRWSTYQITMVIFNRYPAKFSGYQMSVVHLSVWKQTVVTQTELNSITKAPSPSTRTCWMTPTFVRTKKSIFGTSTMVNASSATPSKASVVRAWFRSTDLLRVVPALAICWSLRHSYVWMKLMWASMSRNWCLWMSTTNKWGWGTMCRHKLRRGMGRTSVELIRLPSYFHKIALHTLSWRKPMYVVITDNNTAQNYRVGPIHLSGVNYTPTEEEYFKEAWRIACDDGLVDAKNHASYSFVLG